MTESGAIALANALQQNKSLEGLKWVANTLMLCNCDSSGCFGTIPCVRFDGRAESATAFSASVQKPYHIKYILRHKLYMKLCITQARMQSPDWLNITVKSTLYQVRMIILLSTSTNSKSYLL